MVNQHLTGIYPVLAFKFTPTNNTDFVKRDLYA